MSGNGHTPGPWEVMGADPQRVCAHVKGWPTTVAVVNRERDVPLIAAGPEMLAALREVLPFLDECVETDELVSDEEPSPTRRLAGRVRAVIAKVQP